MAYYLGFDGGGSKTECVLLDSAGQPLARGEAGPSNPLRIGFEKAFGNLRAAAEQALTAAGVEARQLQGVCAGVAGAGNARVVKRLMVFLVEAFPSAHVQVTTDSAVALEAAAGAGPGVVLIAGTGSICMGRNAAGQIVRAGGMGPWVGDEGSAFDIGRRAVMAVARARDALAPVTLLSEMIPSALELPNWEELLARVAEAPDEVFPRIFPLVAEAAAQEDAAAREILFTAALGLAQLAASVIRRLGLGKEKFRLAKFGGVFGQSPLLDDALNALLRGTAPLAEIGMLDVSPAAGAAQCALRLVAAAVNEAAHGAKN